MDGGEVLSRLRETAAGIPVIVVSGQPQTRTDSRGSEHSVMADQARDHR